MIGNVKPYSLTQSLINIPALSCFTDQMPFLFQPTMSKHGGH